MSLFLQTAPVLREGDVVPGPEVSQFLGTLKRQRRNPVSVDFDIEHFP